ncbi:MAG: hypothetical protein AAB387_00175, partial [candidate division NC10 bacterium]
LERAKKTMIAPIIFDGRNIYDPERMKKAGVEYHSIGRMSGHDKTRKSPRRDGGEVAGPRVTGAEAKPRTHNAGGTA